MVTARGTLAALVALVLPGGYRHPMHSAVAEVIQAPAGDSVTIRLRLYADDLRLAIPAATTMASADSALARYVRGAFTLTDRQGRPHPLRWGGASPVGDVVVLTLHTVVPGGLAGARILNLLLCERFEDQVNIVRARYGPTTATLLFTKGETAKTLP